MKKIYSLGFFLFIFCSCFISVTAQSLTSDSTVVKISKNKMPEEKFYLDIEPHALGDKRLKEERFGFGFGYQFTPMIRIGFHHNHIGSFTTTDAAETDGIPKGSEIRYHYENLNAEIVLIDNRFLEIFIPIEVGGGHSWYMFENVIYRKRTVWLTEGSVQLLFFPLATLGIGGGAGYRYPFKTDDMINYEGFFYDAKVRFYFNLRK